MKVLLYCIIFMHVINAAVIDMSVQRASEQRLYDVITKINIVHFYINDYIINNGISPGSKITLTDTYAPMITQSDWPKDVNTLTTKVDFVVDFSNNVVEYENIFTTIPNADTLDLARKNVALHSDAYFTLNDTLSNYNLIIPLELKVIRFMQKVSNILSRAETIVSGNDSMGCTMPLNGYTWYHPDGAGGFSTYSCFLTTWIPVPNTTNLDLVDSTLYVSPIKYNRMLHINSGNAYEIIYKDKTTYGQIH